MNDSVGNDAVGLNSALQSALSAPLLHQQGSYQQMAPQHILQEAMVQPQQGLNNQQQQQLRNLAPRNIFPQGQPIQLVTMPGLQGRPGHVQLLQPISGSIPVGQYTQSQLIQPGRSIVSPQYTQLPFQVQQQQQQRMTVQTVNPSVAPRLLPPQTMPRPPQMTIRSSQMQGSQQNQQQSQQGQQKPPPMAQPPQLTQAQFQSQNVPELVTIDSDTPSPIEQLEQKEEAETADMPVLDRQDEHDSQESAESEESDDFTFISRCEFLREAEAYRKHNSRVIPHILPANSNHGEIVIMEADRPFVTTTSVLSSADEEESVLNETIETINSSVEPEERSKRSFDTSLEKPIERPKRGRPAGRGRGGGRPTSRRAEHSEQQETQHSGERRSQRKDLSRTPTPVQKRSRKEAEEREMKEDKTEKDDKEEKIEKGRKRKMREADRLLAMDFGPKAGERIIQDRRRSHVQNPHFSSESPPPRRSGKTRSSLDSNYIDDRSTEEEETEEEYMPYEQDYEPPVRRDRSVKSRASTSNKDETSPEPESFSKDKFKEKMKENCVLCGEPILKKRWHRPQFCSNRCRDRHQATKEEVQLDYHSDDHSDVKVKQKEMEMVQVRIDIVPEDSIGIPTEDQKQGGKTAGEGAGSNQRIPTKQRLKNAAESYTTEALPGCEGATENEKMPILPKVKSLAGPIGLEADIKDKTKDPVMPFTPGSSKDSVKQTVKIAQQESKLASVPGLFKDSTSKLTSKVALHSEGGKSKDEVRAKEEFPKPESQKTATPKGTRSSATASQFVCSESPSTPSPAPVTRVPSEVPDIPVQSNPEHWGVKDTCEYISQFPVSELAELCKEYDLDAYVFYNGGEALERIKRSHFKMPGGRNIPLGPWKRINMIMGRLKELVNTTFKDEPTLARDHGLSTSSTAEELYKWIERITNKDVADAIKAQEMNILALQNCSAEELIKFTNISYGHALKISLVVSKAMEQGTWPMDCWPSKTVPDIPDYKNWNYMTPEYHSWLKTFVEGTVSEQFEKEKIDMNLLFYLNMTDYCTFLKLKFGVAKTIEAAIQHIKALGGKPSENLEDVQEKTPDSFFKPESKQGFNVWLMTIAQNPADLKKIKDHRLDCDFLFCVPMEDLYEYVKLPFGIVKKLTLKLDILRQMGGIVQPIVPSLPQKFMEDCWQWDCQGIAKWADSFLSRLNRADYEKFAEAKIDGKCLPLLTTRNMIENLRLSYAACWYMNLRLEKLDLKKLKDKCNFKLPEGFANFEGEKMLDWLSTNFGEDVRSVFEPMEVKGAYFAFFSLSDLMAAGLKFGPALKLLAYIKESGINPEKDVVIPDGSPSGWKVEDVCLWVSSLTTPEVAQKMKENEIDGQNLGLIPWEDYDTELNIAYGPYKAISTMFENLKSKRV